MYGVTQGYPLSPIILNIVVDAVIWNWVALVTGGGFGRSVQWAASFFYKDDGIFASLCPSCLQEALSVMIGIFDRLGKMARMV